MLLSKLSLSICLMGIKNKNNHFFKKLGAVFFSVSLFRISRFL